MPGRRCSLIAMIVLLFSISCAQPEPEQAAPSPAPVEEAAEVDPTVADPDHYTVELDNDRVRVLRIAYGPGEESVMHSHPDSVAVFLTSAVAEMTAADGSTEELSVSAGQAVFAPARQHKGKNIANTPWEVIEVELTPNRGDCLGISGVAREVGVVNRIPVGGPALAPVRPTCTSIASRRVISSWAGNF